MLTLINAFPRHFLNILNENSLKNLKYLTFEDYSQIFFEASSNCNDERHSDQHVFCFKSSDQWMLFIP